MPYWLPEKQLNYQLRKLSDTEEEHTYNCHRCKDVLRFPCNYLKVCNCQKQEEK